MLQQYNSQSEEENGQLIHGEISFVMVELLSNEIATEGIFVE
jgi:hypothetical protein